MQHTDFTLTKANGQPRKPRNQAEFRSAYIADLELVAETNGRTLSRCSTTAHPSTNVTRRQEVPSEVLRR